MNVRSITECLNIRGKRVLLRSGLNVPVKDGVVVNDFRIKRAFPTIEFLRKHGARVIVMGHLSHVGEESTDTMEPVCEVINHFAPTKWAGGILGSDVEKKVRELKNGEILMLENLRLDKREKTNDDGFARALASLGEIYVNDAFSVAHRDHASVVGVPKYLPSYAGLLFTEEMEKLSQAMAPENPALFVLGGAKFETKMPLAERLIKTYDRVFIGGALANDFFRLKGYEIGDSLRSDADLKHSPLLDHPKVLLPIDVVVQGAHGRVIKSPKDVGKGEAIFDAGPATVGMLGEQVRFAKTILWNGPLGDYEKGFSEHTERFAKIVASAPGISIVGGGDTIASIEKLNVKEKFDFLSTAGGAMLSFIEFGTLPGIEALKASE